MQFHITLSKKGALEDQLPVPLSLGVDAEIMDLKVAGLAPIQKGEHSPTF